MSGFKLIAIRPISEDFSKILKPGQVYQFYNNYEFEIDDSGHVRNIICSPGISSELYNIKRLKPLKDINVSISAIVGENGSGKSSLLELLFSFCFILGYKKGLINLDYLKDKIPLENSNIVDLIEKFGVEVFYEYENEIYQIFYNATKIHQRKLNNNKWQVSKFDFSRFFYTLATNYSLYGLNALDSNWFYHLFHKNDGYQTPIVINPFRENGAIDVNSEHHLAQSRLLSNISSYFDNSPVINGDKEIQELKFIFDPEEYDQIGIFPMSRVMETFEKGSHRLTIFDFFNKISLALAGFELSKQEINTLSKIKDIDAKAKRTEKYLFERAPQKFTNNDIRYQFIKYIIRKVFKICSSYKEYNEQFLLKRENDAKGVPPIPELTEINKLIAELKRDKSHLTLKLRQVLFAIKTDFFITISSEVVRKTSNYKNFVIDYTVDYKRYKSLVNNSYEKNKKFTTEKIEIVPGAMVKPTIKFVGESDFMSLSSGELQFLHTYHTIIYHLYNINSVFRTKKESNVNSSKVVYQNINIVLDEIELYFHPQLQKSFIKELLEGIKRLNLENIANVNILFSTHSPFILSDIPSQNILKLVKGEQQPYDLNQQTFGANINDILANDFFLKSGFMGDFSKTKIREVIQSLRFEIVTLKIKKLSEINSSENHIINELILLETELMSFKEDKILSKLNCEQIISIVGEPILFNSLMELYSEAYPNRKNEFINERIKSLENLKK